jgi:pimeloyl-ACP methyl ester carboxylesterase
LQRFFSLAAVASAIGATLWLAAPAGASTTVPAPAQQSISWGPCSDLNLQAFNAECGYLSVPLDYNNPSGPQIQLAVSRIQHTSSDYQGIILTNPGGPGGSGVGLNPFLVAQLQQDGQLDPSHAQTYGSAAFDYDWIGFDPRGVGSSIPAISCDPNYFSPNRPFYIPFTHQLLTTWLSRSQGYANNCASQSAQQTALLHHMTTADVARDMDSIRQALGQPQINYYGFSYGTYLGQVYSTLFPSHVRRLIMDSNVDPRRVWYPSQLDQDIAFNRNINIWFGWLAKYDSVYHLGSTEQAVARAFYTTEAQLAFNPAGGQVGPDEWVDIFLQPGYYQQTWLQFAQPFSDWINHHDTAAANELISFYNAVDTPGNDNAFAVYLGVQCTDAPWPTNWNTWSRDNWRTFFAAPFETWGNAWFNAPCIYWPAPPSHPVHINGRGIGNALLIDETLDGATPFQGSLEVRKLFPNSVLLAEPGGTSHADSLFGNLCVDGTIAAYLATGALPPRNDDAQWDKTCAPLPVPVPQGATAAAAAAKGSARIARPRARGSRQAGALGQATRPMLRLGLPAVEIR